MDNRNKDFYYTDEYRQKQAQKLDRNFGPILDHKKVCERCQSEYLFKGREKTKSYTRSRFCSKSCANHRGSGLEWEQTIKSRSITNYRTICFLEWEQKCAVCDFDKIISVHHVDGDHQNNEARNLIPLCPNHHHMVHSKEWGSDMKKCIEQLVNTKWGYNSAG